MSELDNSSTDEVAYKKGKISSYCVTIPQRTVFANNSFIRL